MAVNVTGLSPVTVAVAVWLPAMVPSVHSTDVVPFASVIDDDALSVPDLAAQATLMPDTLRPCASDTLIVRGSGNLVPTRGVAWASPETSATVDGLTDGPDESPHAIVNETTAQ